MPYVLQGNTVPGIPVLHRPLPPGVPTLAEYIRVYCAARGVEVPTRHELVYFLALSLFRIAAILAGVGARARMVSWVDALCGSAGVLVCGFFEYRGNACVCFCT